jgi:hypothetical protein
VDPAGSSLFFFLVWIFSGTFLSRLYLECGAVNRNGCLLMPMKPTHYDCVDVYMMDVMQKDA